MLRERNPSTIACMNTGHVSYRGTVSPSQCDYMGHMSVAFYIQRFEEGAWQLLLQLGVTGARMREQRTGVAAVEQRISYRKELRAGDAFIVRSGVRAVGDSSLRIWQEIRHDPTDELSAEVELVGVHLDLVARRAVRLPDDVRERAEAMVPVTLLPAMPGGPALRASGRDGGR